MCSCRFNKWELALLYYFPSICTGGIEQSKHIILGEKKHVYLSISVLCLDSTVHGGKIDGSRHLTNCVYRAVLNQLDNDCWFWVKQIYLCNSVFLCAITFLRELLFQDGWQKEVGCHFIFTSATTVFIYLSCWIVVHLTIETVFYWGFEEEMSHLWR